MSKKDVILLGASGHGKVVADAVLLSGDRVLGFLDDRVPRGQSLAGFPVLGDTEQFYHYPDAYFLVAIGNAEIRAKLVKRLGGVQWYTAIHPRAVISLIETQIGPGSVVLANAVLNPGAVVGAHCIINTGAIVEHDNRIGDFAHISVGARLAGTVSVGAFTWVGAGATVRNNLSICDRCMIGAGAVVVKNIEESGTYIGVPARKKHEESTDFNEP